MSVKEVVEIGLDPSAFNAKIGDVEKKLKSAFEGGAKAAYGFGETTYKVMGEVKRSTLANVDAYKQLNAQASASGDAMTKALANFGAQMIAVKGLVMIGREFVDVMKKAAGQDWTNLEESTAKLELSLGKMVLRFTDGSAGIRSMAMAVSDLADAIDKGGFTQLLGTVAGVGLEAVSSQMDTLGYLATGGQYGGLGRDTAGRLSGALGNSLARSRANTSDGAGDQALADYNAALRGGPSDKAKEMAAAYMFGADSDREKAAQSRAKDRRSAIAAYGESAAGDWSSQMKDVQAQFRPIIAAEKQYQDESLKAREIYNDKIAKLGDDQLAYQVNLSNKMAEEVEASNKASLDSVNSVVGPITDAFASLTDGIIGGLFDMAEGNEVAWDKILLGTLKGLGGELFAMGLKDEAAGVSRGLSSYGFDPTAYALIAQGGVEMGLGAAMLGGALLGTSAATTARGGGGAGSAGSFSGGSAGAGGSVGRPNLSVVDAPQAPINIYMMGSELSAKDARFLEQGIRNAKRRVG